MSWFTAPTGHDWSRWEDPTASGGTQVRTCKRCGITQERDLTDKPTECML